MVFPHRECREYLLESVDENGKTEEEHKRHNYSRGWRPVGTRLDRAVKSEVDGRVRDVVKNASEAALAAVGAAYKEKIECAVKMAIESVKIKVEK